MDISRHDWQEAVAALDEIARLLELLREAALLPKYFDAGHNYHFINRTACSDVLLDYCRYDDAQTGIDAAVLIQKLQNELMLANGRIVAAGILPEWGKVIPLPPQLDKLTRDEHDDDCKSERQSFREAYKRLQAELEEFRTCLSTHSYETCVANTNADDTHPDSPVITVAQAAAMMGKAKATLQKFIYTSRKAGHSPDWLVSPQKGKKGILISREKFEAWLCGDEKRGKGRPRSKIG